MAKKEKNMFIHYVLERLSSQGINELSVKPLFGGYGICHRQTMFGWIFGERFYLKGHDRYLMLFKQYNMPALRLEYGVTAKLLQYYLVTDRLLQHKKKFLELIHIVIELAHQDKERQFCAKESRIKDLPNMTLSLERQLNRVGIHSVMELRQFGAFKSYRKLIQQNKQLSSNILFMLYTALVGYHALILSEHQKEQLKQEYEHYQLNILD